MSHDLPVALGTWHGCVVIEGRLSCWGRGDRGQLGAPARDRCGAVACARSPRPTPIKVAAGAAIAAGDLFTCASDRGVISCWGGSRDGFFGEPGSCPEWLRRAWPTPRGVVPAPRAGCSARPVAIARNLDEERPWLSAGPRGVCFPGRKGEPGRCLGGIVTPTEPMVVPRAGPGDDASGCALEDGRILCWGEGYSPPSAPGRPVPITFVTSRSAEDYAAIDLGEPKQWAEDCLIHGGCDQATAPLPACPPGKARDWSEVWSHNPKSLVGQLIALRGPLGVGRGSTTLMGCGGRAGRTGCCNHTGADIVLGGAPEIIALEGFRCRGDDSRECCNAPAYGQTVVATGTLRLAPAGEAAINRSGWRLLGARLCVEMPERSP